MADAGFDPRFDAAFQPGYDPTKHAASAVTVTAHEPVHLSQPAGLRVESAAGPAGPAEAVPVSVPVPAEGAAIESAASAQPKRRNPLLVSLWIISAVLVAIGAYGLRLIADRVNSLGTSGGFGEADYYLMQAYTVLSPLLITLGIATAIGTVFLLALRSRH